MNKYVEKFLQAIGEAMVAQEIEEFTEANLHSQIWENNGIMAVYFYVPDAIPCKNFEETLYPSLRYKAPFIKINANHCSKTIEKLNIRSVPAVVIYDDYRPLQKFIGNARCERISDFLDELLASKQKL